MIARAWWCGVAELYFCSNCNKLNELNQHGRCSKCDSDAVLSVEKIQSALNGTKVFVSNTKIDEKIGWIFQYGAFECFVSFSEATDLISALRIANSGQHPWYVKTVVSQDDVSVVDITRNEWCDWVRS
jgi:hypothetical protein